MPISYTTTQYPIQKLLTWREKGKLRVPIHQRGFVWDNNRKINLIDTIMRSLPIPSLTLSVSLDAQSIKKYWIEDGQQRITTIQKYVNNEYVNKQRILFCNLSLPQQHQTSVHNGGICQYAAQYVEDSMVNHNLLLENKTED